MLCTFGEDVSLSIRLHAMPRQLPLIHDLQKLEFGKKLLGSVHTELHSKIAKSYQGRCSMLKTEGVMQKLGGESLRMTRL